MIKLLVFAPNFNGGGAERVLINYLCDLDKSKYSITLVLVEKKGVLLTLVPEHVNLISLGKRKTIYCIPALRKLINSLNVDIVYSTLIRTHIVLNLAILGIENKPKLILRSPNSPKLLRENKQLGFFQSKLLNFAYKKADTVIAQTPEMKDELNKYNFVELEKVKVFINPLNTNFIDKQSNVEYPPFSREKINVVASGRLIEQKGFDVLIDCFKSVVENNSSFHLHILGEDVSGKLNSLLNRCEILDLSNNVTFHGFQKNPYIFYKNADLYVLSSRWEGMPNTVIENLYLQTPVVATKCIPFLNQLIENGKNGWLVEVDNKDELAAAILSSGKLLADKYDANKFKSNINELFHIKRAK